MTSKPSTRTFSAVLTHAGNKLNWVIVYIPFDAAKVWGSRGQIRVKGDIEGFPIQGILFPTGDGRHYLIVNKTMQKGGKVRPGMEARFRLEFDPEKRVTPVPPELEQVLRKSKRLQQFFGSLSSYTRRWLSEQITGAKSPETRMRRASRVAEQLLETLEAESELPPMIRQFLVRNPEAAQAWQRISPAQRRGNLLAIFYYQNPDARLRRMEKALVELSKDSDKRTGDS